MKRIICILCLAFLFTCTLPAKGYWEFGGHYSTWSLNILKTAIESNLSEAFVSVFQNYFEDEGIEYNDVDPDRGQFNFKTSGYNYGFSIRFFPGGADGSFSLGVSYERNEFRLNLDGNYSDTNILGYEMSLDGDAAVILRPHSINFGFRWDVWPRASVHPYIGFAFGIGALEGSFSGNARASFTTPLGQQNFTFNESLTVDEAIDKLEEESEEKFPLTFFPIVHFQIGLRGRISDNFYILGEIAVYDGIIFRGGLAIRL